MQNDDFEDFCDIDDPIDFDWDGSDDIDDDMGPKRSPKSDKDPEETARIRAIRTRQRIITRRAMSEQAMNEVLDWHLEEGCAYHCISGGDVDALTYVRGVVKQHPIDYLLISTWCMSMADADEIADWLQRGLVKRCDVYVGEIFIQHYAMIFDKLCEVLPPYGGRLCMTRNHAKVSLLYWHGGACAITSSANVNTNPRIEQTVLTVDKEVADFYKGFFDDLKPKNPWSIPWTPWEV